MTRVNSWEIVYKVLEREIDPAAKTEEALKEKIDVLRKLLQKGKQVHFGELFMDARNRTEVIVSFLAILELVKQKSVLLKQDKSFNDIIIHKI